MIIIKENIFKCSGSQVVFPSKLFSKITAFVMVQENTTLSKHRLSGKGAGLPIQRCFVQNHWVALWSTQRFVLPRSIKWLSAYLGEMVFESNLCPANGSIALLQVNLTIKRENFFFQKKNYSYFSRILLHFQIKLEIRDKHWSILWIAFR